MSEVSQKKTYLALFTSILALSQAPILVRLAEASAEVLGFWRVVFTSILTVIIMYVQKESLDFDFIKKNFQNIIIAGVFFCLHFWLWFRGVQNTSVANAIVIFNLNPIFIAVLSKLFHKERLTPKLILALFMGLLGVLIIKWNSLSIESYGTIGDLYVFGGCIVFAFYVIKVKGLRRTGSNLNLTLFFNLICIVGFGVGVIAKSQSFVGYSNQSWMAFVGMAVVPSILGHSLFTYCLKHISATVASCCKLFEPVTAALVAALIFGEAITLRLVIGFAVVALGLLNLYLRD